MSHTSLNPRGSALSPHALSILRPLLRRIALSHPNSLEYILANAGGALAEADETPKYEVKALFQQGLEIFKAHEAHAEMMVEALK